MTGRTTLTRRVQARLPDTVRVTRVTVAEDASLSATFESG